MSPAKTPQQTRDQIVKLRQEGKTYREIRELSGVGSDAIVAKYLSEAGLTQKRTPIPTTPAQTAVIESLQPEAQPEPAKAPAAPTPGSEADPWECGKCSAKWTSTSTPSMCPSCGAGF